MSNYKITALASILLTIILFSCNEDKENEAYPDLRLYLDRFEEEARQRGYDLDLSGVETAYVDDIPVGEFTACGIGYVNYQGTGVRRIEISREERCWAGRNETERENLFFHEIGHAFLNRNHDETKLCDGAPASMMAGKFNTFNFYDGSQSEKRAYYISELLDRLVAVDQCIQPLKDWSTDPVFYSLQRQDTAWYFHSDEGNYAGGRSPDLNDTPDFLTIASEAGSSTQNSAYWLRQFNVPNIPECAEIKLKVSMNAEELSAPGAAVAIRAYESVLQQNGAITEEYLFVGTEDNPVSGKLTDHTEEFVIPCFSRKTTYLIIFAVMMPGTEGEVRFDDIQLTVNEK
ncbi:hypothetical protein WJR50_14695 [Catalinimonas sp. 4WD22]|uniref:hypothetical protein n=1 Tax=Catalinimonas locisalis TaxID=3133978 RepID=UPI003100FB82